MASDDEAVGAPPAAAAPQGQRLGARRAGALDDVQDPASGGVDDGKQAPGLAHKDDASGGVGHGSGGEHRPTPPAGAGRCGQGRDGQDRAGVAGRRQANQPGRAGGEGGDCGVGAGRAERDSDNRAPEVGRRRHHAGPKHVPQGERAVHGPRSHPLAIPGPRQARDGRGVRAPRARYARRVNVEHADAAVLAAHWRVGVKGGWQVRVGQGRVDEGGARDARALPPACQPACSLAKPNPTHNPIRPHIHPHQPTKCRIGYRPGSGQATAAAGLPTRARGGRLGRWGLRGQWGVGVVGNGERREAVRPTSSPHARPAPRRLTRGLHLGAPAVHGASGGGQASPDATAAQPGGGEWGVLGAGVPGCAGGPPSRSCDGGQRE